MEMIKLSSILNPCEDEEEKTRAIKQGKWQKAGLKSGKYSWMRNNINDKNNPENQTRQLSKRKRINKEQFEQLTALYTQTDTPSHEIREQIGIKLGMTNREVQVWFQNKRAKNNKLLKHRKNIHIPQPIKVLDHNDNDEGYLKYTGLTPPITPTASVTFTAGTLASTSDKAPPLYSRFPHSDYESVYSYPTRTAPGLCSSQQGQVWRMRKTSEGTNNSISPQSPVFYSRTPLETPFVPNNLNWSKVSSRFIRRNDAHSNLTLPSIKEIGINVLAEAVSYMANK